MGGELTRPAVTACGGGGRMEPPSPPARDDGHVPALLGRDPRPSLAAAVGGSETSPPQLQAPGSSPGRGPRAGGVPAGVRC